MSCENCNITLTNRRKLEQSHFNQCKASFYLFIMWKKLGNDAERLLEPQRWFTRIKLSIPKKTSSRMLVT